MKLTNERVGIIDRFYMRIYYAYLNKKDPARFTTCLNVGLTIGLLLSPFPIFFAELFRADDGYIDAIILLLYAISILAWTFGTYHEERIRQLKAMNFSYRSKYFVPTWCLFMIMPIGFIWAFFMYWLMLRYLIYPYQLEGIFIKMIHLCKHIIQI